MILKFRNTLKEWRSLYTDAIKNRLRRDLNLSDVFNVQTTRDNIGLSGDNNHTHYHDDRYMPVISRGDAAEAKSRTDADDKLSKRIDKVIVDYQNADTYTYNTLMNEIDKLRKNIENNIQKQIDALDKFTRGTILLWYGNLKNIPTGWAVCDGQNGTPDMRDRFAEGAGGTYACGAMIEAGLPNIYGRTGSNSYGGTGSGADGAFYFLTYTTTYGPGNTDNDNYAAYMDASRCSSVYGRSNTVQPSARALYYIMKL